MLEHLEATLERWAQAVHTALLHCDHAGAQAALDSARAELSSGGMPAEDQAAPAIYLRLLDVQAAGLSQQPHAAEHYGPLLLAALDEVEAQQAASEAARIIRARVLFQLACMADCAGVRPFSTAQAEALLAQIPEAARDNACWIMLANWAFHNSLQEQMFAAYTEFLVRRKASLSRYSWERLRLMYLLVAGQAIFRDVEAAIDKLPHKHQAEHFARVIRPRLEELGIWDEKLELKHVLKVVDLDEREHEPIPPDPEHRAPRTVDPPQAGNSPE